MSQGIPRNKEKVIEALRPYFELDYSVKKACELVGVPQSTVQTWIDADDDLRVKIQGWQAQSSVLARKNWVEAIEKGIPTKNGPDKYTPAKDWLERREKGDWSTRTETDITTNGESINVPMTPAILEATRKFEEEMKKAIL